MRRIHAQLLGVCIVSIMAVFLVIAVYNPVTPNTLSWGLDEGDILSFVLVVSGGHYEYHSDPGTPPDYIELNGSVVRAQVISLPDIPELIDNDTFFQEIVLETKVSCTFDNASPLPDYVETHLTELISYSLLPIGDWDLLDEFFTYDIVRNWYHHINEKTCDGEMCNETFHLTVNLHEDWMHAIYERWEGYVDFTTGVPASATFNDVSFSCIGSGSLLSLQLHLVNHVPGPDSK